MKKKNVNGNHSNGSKELYCRRLGKLVDSSQAQMVYVTKFRKCKICQKCA